MGGERITYAGYLTDACALRQRMCELESPKQEREPTAEYAASNLLNAYIYIPHSAEIKHNSHRHYSNISPN